MPMLGWRNAMHCIPPVMELQACSSLQLQKVLLHEAVLYPTSARMHMSVSSY